MEETRLLVLNACTSVPIHKSHYDPIMIEKVDKRTSDRVKVTFVLPEDHPYDGDISVVGDFNDWTPGEHRFVRRSNQTYSTNVKLPEDHRFAFRYYSDEDGWINEDDADDVEPNEFGTTNCVVTT